MILPQLGQSGALDAYSSERSRRMNKAVLEPRCPDNIGSLLEPASDIGDSHHVLYHHRANVIAAKQRQRICGKSEEGRSPSGEPVPGLLSRIQLTPSQLRS
jgi:hypothetical protein